MVHWTCAFRLWGDLIRAFNRKGGRVAYGTDDNYIWATRASPTSASCSCCARPGWHSLEILKAATHNSAETLRQPKLGLVRPGFLADVVFADGNPGLMEEVARMVAKSRKASATTWRHARS